MPDLAGGGRSKTSSMNLTDFQPAATVPDLAAGEIHLWNVNLALAAGEVRTLRHLLVDDEPARADRFHFDRHRRRFTVRRARRRQLIAAYQELAPTAVRFTLGERDKPYLDEVQNHPRRLDFNLSDSEDLAVYAFSRDLELGVDTEVLRPMPDALKISERFFADGERAVLGTVAADRVGEAFFNCWTRKEAYIKAIGKGLSEPLDRFCVTLRPGEPCRFLHIGDDEREAAAWSLLHFVPAPGAVGALAFRDHGWTVSCRSWAGD